MKKETPKQATYYYDNNDNATLILKKISGTAEFITSEISLQSTGRNFSEAKLGMDYLVKKLKELDK
jgi:hypothetical protein